ncbi:hypothetical protein E4T56_gene19312 [Termitomyces sp. T112]|nr:hypothetical protein E4T56_gene19312 [Termitomyces sp. T112]
MDQQLTTILNYYVGALTIVGGLVTTFVFCYNLLPRARMKVFQKILLETRDLYQQVKDEGLVPVSITDDFETRLQELEENSISLRDSAHQCTSLLQEVIAAYHGLSNAIQISIRQAIDLQATIATASEEQRKARRLPTDLNRSSSLLTSNNSGGPSRLCETYRSAQHFPQGTCDDVPDLPDNSDTQHDMGGIADSSSTAFSTTKTVEKHVHWNTCLLAFLLQWRHPTKQDKPSLDLESGMPAAGNNTAARP